MKLWRKAVAALLAASAGWAVWARVVEPWRDDRQYRYAARNGLETLAKLEQVYCFQSGRYTADLLALASMTQEPQKILNMADTSFVPGSLRLRADAASARLSAAALDRGGTTIAIEARRPATP